MTANINDHPLLPLARAGLQYWDIPNAAEVRLINVSENTTFLVEAPDFKSVLRIHRSGYHSRRAIECELAWLDALAAETDIATPGYMRGRNGSAIQAGQIAGLDAPRFMVMFEFLPGAAPSEDGDLTTGFLDLGAIAARCHEHVLNWEKPSDFKRLTWDLDTVFGTSPTWGRWQDAPGVTSDIHAVLTRVEAHLKKRLHAFGKPPHRFNLIHADMRLANLLVDGAQTRLIDFDDCGFGWFLYDFAAAISFIEDDPRVPELKSAWLEGYRKYRPISAEEDAEIDSLVMLRRMALLAWIGSHMEAPEPQALAPDFAKNSAMLGDDWLSRN